MDELSPWRPLAFSYLKPLGLDSELFFWSLAAVEITDFDLLDPMTYNQDSRHYPIGRLIGSAYV